MSVCRSNSQDPCGKQHFREIPTPDFVSKCTNQAYYLVDAIVVKSLQNPAWVFRGNVVSHMAQDDDSMSMCLSKSQDDDSMSMCLSSSH